MEKITTFLKEKYNKILIYFLLLVIIFYNYSNLRRVNFDHLLFNNFNFIGLMKRTYEFTVKSQGRPSFLQILFTPIEYLLSNYWIWSIVYVLSIGIICGLIVYEILNKNKEFYELTFLLTITFYSITLEPIAIPLAYSFSLGIAIITLLLSVYFHIKWIKYNLQKYKYLSCFYMLISCFTYEIAIMYLPLLIATTIYMKHSIHFKMIIKNIKEYIFSGAIYTIMYILVKLKFPGEYAGTQINGNFDIRSTLFTTFLMLISRIPGFSFFYDKSNAYNSTRNYLKNLNNILDNNIKVETLVIFIGSILFIIIIWNLCKYIRHKSIADKNLILNKDSNLKTKLSPFLWIIILIYAIIIPIIPSSLTTYSQDQVAAHWRLEGIGNQYSYCFIIINIILLFKYLLNQLKIKKILIIGFIMISSSLFILTSLTNLVNSKIVLTLGNKLEKFDIILEDLTENCEDNSLIYSPTLLNNCGVLQIPIDYFNNRIRFLTGKNIGVTNSLNNIEQDSEVYYLKYLYSFDNTEFAISKLNVNEIIKYEKELAYTHNPRLLIDNAKLYIFNDYNYYLIGNTQDNMININEEYIRTSGTFSKKIDKNEKHNASFDIINIKGKNINFISLITLPEQKSIIGNSELINLQNTSIGTNLSSAEILYGYWQDGWATTETKLRLQSGNQGNLKIAVILPVNYDDFSLDIYANGEYIGNINNKKNLCDEFNIPKNEIIYLQLETDNYFKSEDGRILSYLLTNVECE